MTDRAVSTTLAYAIGLAITTILISGLLIAGGTFVEAQESQAVRTELQVTGQRIAADTAGVDRTAATVENGSLSVTRTYTDTVVNSEYEVSVERVGDTPTYEFTLEAIDNGETATVRTYSDAPVFTGDTVRGGTIEYEVNNALRPKIILREPGDTYRFKERNGLVVIEAETPLDQKSGKDIWADHRWLTFTDQAASGREAITTMPNVSSSGTPPYTGGGTDDTKNGPRLDYPVTVETTGEYYVWVRMRTPSTNPGRSDSVHVALDNGTLASDGGQGLSEGAGTSWSWVNRVSDTSDRVTVDVSSPGVHTINLWMREDGTQVDKIILVDNSSYDPNSDPVPSAWWSA